MVSESLATEIQKLAPSAMIELFELDTTSLGGEIYRFHAGTNQLHQNVVWKGDTYVRYPVEVSGFEFAGQGQFPRPRLKVANILSAITLLTMDNDDLLGAKLSRKRTLAKFLDAVNFTGGVNPDADPNSEFPDDVYYIDRKASEDRDVVEFELASSMDLNSVMLPRRQIIQNLCPWQYRGSECGYTGPPEYDINDQRIATSGSHSTEAQAVLDHGANWRSKRSDLDHWNGQLTIAEASKFAECAKYSVAQQAASYGALATKDQYPLLATSVPGISYGVVKISEHNVLTFEAKGYWNGVLVTLAEQYRIGARVARYRYFDPAYASNYYVDVFYIQRYAQNISGECALATSTYNSILASRDSAHTAHATAETDYNTAVAALPEDDPIFAQDRCGKRLTSCKLRFGEKNPLPFGGFPAAGLSR